MATRHAKEKGGENGNKNVKQLILPGKTRGGKVGHRHKGGDVLLGRKPTRTVGGKETNQTTKGAGEAT